MPDIQPWMDVGNLDDPERNRRLAINLPQLLPPLSRAPISTPPIVPGDSPLSKATSTIPLPGSATEAPLSTFSPDSKLAVHPTGPKPLAEQYGDTESQIQTLTGTQPVEPHMNVGRKILGTMLAMSTNPQMADIGYKWTHPAAVEQQRQTGVLQQREKGLATQADIAEKEAQTRKLGQPTADKPDSLTAQEAQAVEELVAKGTPRVDAIGQVKGAGQKPPTTKHSPGEVKLDEGIPTGIYGDKDKLWRANDPAMPPELKAALGDAQGAHKQKVQEGLAQATAGRAVLAGSKAVNMIKADGTLIAVNGEDLPKFMRENPGSVEAGASAGTQAMGKQALISDIRRAANNVNQNLDVLNRKGFDYAKLAATLADPSTTAEAYLQAIPRGSLDDKGQQFVSDLFSLREQAMAMRSVLGAGQGSEDMRRAILNTLPGISSGSKGFGQKQIKNLLAALDTLEKGIPKTPMRPDATPSAPKTANDPLGIL